MSSWSGAKLNTGTNYVFNLFSALYSKMNLLKIKLKIPVNPHKQNKNKLRGP
jgi:hypothetical protein